MEWEEQVLSRLLAKDSLLSNEYLVYRLSQRLTLPIECLFSRKALGECYPLDPARLRRALEKIPFVRLHESTLQLAYPGSYRRVMVTGMRPEVVARFLKGCLQARTVDFTCHYISILCDNKLEAKQLCLRLRDMKSRHHHEKIKANDHARIRIALESTRLYSLFLESVEQAKLARLRVICCRSQGLRVQTVEDRMLLYFGLVNAPCDQSCEKESLGKRTLAEDLFSDDESGDCEHEAARVLAAD